MEKVNEPEFLAMFEKPKTLIEKLFGKWKESKFNQKILGKQGYERLKKIKKG